MKVLSKVELEFAGVTLPVGLDEDGREVVPLKPISDVFGLEWERQRKRAQEDYPSRFLGTCTVHMYCAGQVRDMACIRLDRVAAWMFQINPERVRAAGNEVGADFLIQKHEEWADLIHQYETRKGGMLQAASRDKALHIRLFLSVLRAKRDVSNPAERNALARHAAALSAAAGVSYQPDLLEKGEA